MALYYNVDTFTISVNLVFACLNKTEQILVRTL
jgi:hypothetical protein